MQTVVHQSLMVSSLFDALSESVILFKPVTDINCKIFDFEIVYCNKASSNFFDKTKPVSVGQTILRDSIFDESGKKALFKECLHVWETGIVQEKILYNPYPNRHFSTSITKTADGVISVTTDKTEYFFAEKARQEQSDRFTGILDASADGVMILEAIRNGQKEITDFRLTHCNKAAYKLAKLSPDSINKSLLEILPHLTISEQLELHKRVINTGIPQRIETTFRNEKGEEYGWFIVSLLKMNENVVSTFIDITKKKENEQKIEEQAYLLESIFDVSISAIFACEAIRDADEEITDMKVLKINQAFTRLTGVDAAKAEGANYLSLFPASKKIGMFAEFCEVINTGKSVRRELFYDDEKLKGWYEVSAVKRQNNGIVITFANITESKANKQALEQSSTYLQDVIDSTQTGIMLLSPVKNSNGEITDFLFKTANKTVAALTGKQVAELTGKHYTEVFDEDLEQGLFTHYKEFAEGTEWQKRFETHFVAGKTALWLDVLIKRRDADLLVTVLDFTAKKELQEEIAASAAKLTTVINSSIAGMFTIQPVFDCNGAIEDFRFSLVNKAVAGYIGQKEENLVGAIASSYFPAYKTNGLFDIYADTYLNNTNKEFEFHYQDGYDLYFHINTIKAGNEVLVTFTDYTSLKKLQVQLQSSVDELKKSNASLEEFAYAASHDLQEPLRKINYFSERLRKGFSQKLCDDEKRMFERMENAAARMSQLISDLLTYSQISQSKEVFKLTDLNEIIQQVLGDLDTRITEKNATISATKLPQVQGDAIQLRQLFQNILSNSLKYSKHNIAPHIDIKCKQVSKQINGVYKKFYEIKISDNGIGFDQEYAERIFKVFQRLHGQSEYPGTGIGLAIVQKVIKNHYGTVTAEGIAGEGSTFTVLLPEVV